VYKRQGHIDVHLSTVDYEKNKSIQVRVSDTGIGMSQDTVDSLFERFYQADESTTRKFGGTGLGMAITQGLTHLMGGSITCESVLKKGTTFTVVLPIEQLEAHQVLHDRKTQLGDMPDLAGKKIIIVEDNDINIMVLKTMLENTGAIIFTAQNGQDGVALWRKLQPDLTLMDIHMPKLDGVEATKIIKQESPNSIVIAVTANVMKTDLENYLASGFNDYIPKPIELSALQRVIAKFLS